MTRQIELADSLAFAALSGDFNPMHTDPEAARRLMFGRCVVHGIHTLLLTLDEVLDGPVRALKAWWQKPVFFGDTLTFETIRKDGTDHVTVKKSDRVVLTLVLTPGTIEGSPSIRADAYSHEAPDDVDFATLADAAGTVELRLDPVCSGRLFPRLAKIVPAHQLATIAATTRIVGMKVPGLCSLYTSLSLDFDRAPSAALAYRVRRARRNLLLSIEVEGGGAAGRLETMMRPRPVTQPRYEDVRQRVPEDRFAGQRAVVVGGSRGLGEVTAKLLAAGGAAVTLTYRSGADDAERIRADIRSGGGRADVVVLDVLDAAASRTIPTPTHLYYFATPLITLDEKVVFDTEQFRWLCSFYVDGLVDTIEWARQGDAPLTVFYPSSVYVDAPVPGAAAYAAAKAAGEQTCRALAALDSKLDCVIRRLPRAHTDQTSSLLLAAGADPVDVMLEALKSE